MAETAVDLKSLEDQMAALKAQIEKAKVVPAPSSGLKLDLGCGTKKKEGFIGVDVRKFDGVDIVLDLGRHTWPWEDNSVEEAFSSHTLEHLDPAERCHFFNELWRVLKNDGKAQIILPHWASCRYYGDPTHKSPPFSEFGWHYLSKAWRKDNAPHTDAAIAPGPLSYSCDFAYSYGFSMAPWMMGRSQDFVNFALGAYKEAAQDMIGNLVAQK